MGQWHGLFESVLFSAEPGRGGGHQHCQHHLERIQRFLPGHGQRRWHSHRPEAGGGGARGRGAQCGPEAHCFFRGVLPGVALAALSRVFPQIYNTTDTVRSLAASFICISALFMPFCAYTNAAYFTLRSGGKTLVTFLFDSCFVWCVCVPLAYVLSKYTSLPIVPLYFLCQATETLKCFLGGYMLKRGSWIQNIVQAS